MKLGQLPVTHLIFQSVKHPLKDFSLMVSYIVSSTACPARQRSPSQAPSLLEDLFHLIHKLIFFYQQPAN